LETSLDIIRIFQFFEKYSAYVLGYLKKENILRISRQLSQTTFLEYSEYVIIF
jgi:hypothetical protein